MHNSETPKRVHRVTTIFLLSALAFLIFFQVNKGGPLGANNPFAVDPYDAVGSFAIQVAFLIGLLTYARSLRLLRDPSQLMKLRLILHGNAIVLLAIMFTLMVDALAVTIHPVFINIWGKILLVELSLMFLLVLGCAVIFTVVFWRLPMPDLPSDLTPAEAIDDLWEFIRFPFMSVSTGRSKWMSEWVMRFSSDRLFARLSWVNPRGHPWRFVFLVGIMTGVGLFLLQMFEGPPPTFQIGLFLAGIFITAELAATVVGYAIFGGYLGLRPPFRRYF